MEVVKQALVKFFDTLGMKSNVAEEMAFYGAYHSNPINQLIHVFCVPAIWGTGVVWVAYSPKLFKGAPFWCNWSFLGYLFYASYYAVMDEKTAVVADTFYFLVFYLANLVVYKERKAAILNAKLAGGSQAKPGQVRPSYKAAKWALLIHVLGWYLQIHPGHAIFEGRKPALMDSLSQAVTLAPLFVVYEAIWFLVPGYNAEMKAAVDARIKEIQATM
mmetsp:Transcript_3525/g.6098  ORF Transcript_3525/g.6098 Transcript_3525/m.6098 type:complete len:217 (+) Transcript_3525:90-740(+)